jgi:tetratricopeptide (TPR) repeat protein
MYAEQAGNELLAEARDGLLATGDREAAAEAEALLGQLSRWQGRGEESLEHGRRAAALLEGSEPSRAKALAMVNLSGCLMQAGRNQEAILVGRQALALAELVGDRGLQARAHGPIGGARSFGGDPGGIADLERALAVAVEANAPYSANAYGNLASCAITRGELDRGFELQAKGREAAERFGLANELRIVAAEHVLEDYWRGRWEAAVAGANAFIAETAAGVRHFMEDVCRLVRGRIRLARGELADALEDAAADVELGRQQGAPEALQAALALQAHALLVAGSAEEADARASELLNLLADQGVLVTNPDWSGELAIVLHDLGRGAELLKLVAQLTPTPPWLQAAAAVARGDFEQAAERYRGIGSLPDEASARLRAAEQLHDAGRHTDAEDQRQRALAFYRQVDATAPPPPDHGPAGRLRVLTGHSLLGQVPRFSGSVGRKDRRYRSTTSPTVVASVADLSSRQRPVKRGKRRARPASSFSRSQAAVWVGDRVSSAASTSTTTAGSNQTSAVRRASTRGGRSARASGARRSGRAANSASLKPVPHLQTVWNRSLSGS